MGRLLIAIPTLLLGVSAPGDPFEELAIGAEMRGPMHGRSERGMGKLEGKVALVTGSGRNIGRATVLRLAGEGAHVVNGMLITSEQVPHQET